jgi:NADH dehydrogenase [ubiquinone] 1 alpha subcomplex assembly factor 7
LIEQTNVSTASCPVNALEVVIREIIAAQGAISIAAFMELALQHPHYGYYRKRDPLGRTGDFITAPDVSQLFGEMVGIWCAETWRNLGRPDPFALVELGPGNGTMMRDLLRATEKVGGFHAAKKLCLIDSNELLRAAQRMKLDDSAPQHIRNISEIPDMPAIVLANEFFDALPVRQFEKTFRGWVERMVIVENDALVTTLRPLMEIEINLIPPEMQKVVPGTVFEFSPQAQALMRDLSRILVARKGAALVIDYGYVAASGSPTVQAVSHHASVSILERPGEVDLTAHVDFTALAKAAREGGAKVSAVVGQGEFLKDCGIEIRADSLKIHATPEQATEIESALHRLTDNTQMGTLFKVMEIKG